MSPATTKLIEQFNITRINTGCLEDMACPECGSRGPFRVLCSAPCEINDQNGFTGTTLGDVEWDKDSWCICADGCGHQDEVRAFTFTGLDAQLNERAANRATAAARLANEAG